MISSVPKSLIWLFLALFCYARQQVLETWAGHEVVSIDLTEHFNNKAASDPLDSHGFDGEGNGYVKKYLPRGRWNNGGVTVSP